MDKINIDEIQPSSRKYPAIILKQGREAGDQILHVQDLSKKGTDGMLFQGFDLNVMRGDKIAFLANDSTAITSLFDILAGEQKADSGTFTFGETITPAYLPNENHEFFDTDLNLLDWLRQYSTEKDEVFIRGFLGKMLFSGEEIFKSARVLSGGEKVRCMTSKLMLAEANLLILDEPTNHLDLESIQAMNNALKDYKGTVLFTSHDHAFVSTVANKIIELTPNGHIEKMMSFDDYLSNEKIQEQREALLAGTTV